MNGSIIFLSIKEQQESYQQPPLPAACERGRSMAVRPEESLSSGARTMEGGAECVESDDEGVLLNCSSEDGERPLLVVDIDDLKAIKREMHSARRVLAQLQRKADIK
jgi:hypothetical protein